ncbi:MAG: hypothetical protein JO068_11515 [Hyphomicrobiales bacterium]|nr:hypothetical protein [Hyphomicrobiales bacterium]
MADPSTSIHYAPNHNFASDGTYSPGVDGFNLADISSASQLASLPNGVQGLAWLGMTGGADQSFMTAVNAYVGQPNLYGFYIAEPDPQSVPAANLMAEADYIHSVLPTAKTFIIEYNDGTPDAPVYGYTPANTHIDLFGLDPYPIRPQFSGGADYGVINAGVQEAQNIGVPLADIVPVYQAFGGPPGTAYASWTLPTPAQEQTILSTWGSLVPSPQFDYAYSWGVQSGDVALESDPSLAQVLAQHNSGGSPPPPNPPTIAINTIAGNDIITAAKASAGFVISGTTSGVEDGQPVTVDILNSSQVVLANLQATDQANSWSVTVTNTQATALADGIDIVTANVSDQAGDPAMQASLSLTVDEDRVAEAPTLAFSQGSLTVAKGGSVNLGITASPLDADDRVSVKISGVPSYETITAPSGDSVTHQAQGKTYTWTVTESASMAGTPLTGIMLTSHYKGSGSPVAGLTVTASDVTSGETASSPSQKLSVTDPPAAAPSSKDTGAAAMSNNTALFDQFAAGFHGDHGGAGQIASIAQMQGGDQDHLNLSSNPHRSA